MVSFLPSLLSLSLHPACPVELRTGFYFEGLRADVALDACGGFQRQVVVGLDGSYDFAMYFGILATDIACHRTFLPDYDFSAAGDVALYASVQPEVRLARDVSFYKTPGSHGVVEATARLFFFCFAHNHDVDNFVFAKIRLNFGLII